MLRLCGRCGEEVPVGASCPGCRAPEPRWQRSPRSVATIVGELLVHLATAVGGLACLLAAAAFLHGWIGPGLGQRVLQVLVGVLVVGVGVPVGLILLGASVEGAFVRAWSLPAVDGRGAVASTRFGRLLSASGGGEVTGEVLPVPEVALAALEAFAHYGVLRRAIPPVYGLGNSPARVDVAMMAALVALAGRGLVQLRLATSISWSHDGRRLTRSEVAERVEARRVDAAPTASDGGLVESLLLGAMTPPTATRSPRDGALPYREPAAAAGPSVEAPWVALPDVAFALSRGDGGFRRRLRARLEAAAPPQSDIRPVEAVGAELTAALEAAGDRTLGAAIVRDVERGFARRALVAAQ